MGILPTLRKSDLAMAHMTPRPRYRALNAVLTQLRGGDYEFRLKGADELSIRHDSVMLESGCTSFQVHYQVDPAEFAQCYNLAQAVTAPLLAAAANSPLLFGRRLWRETRIPLFQQSIDTRRAGHHMRERAARVSFGQRWVQHSILELIQGRPRALSGAPGDVPGGGLPGGVGTRGPPGAAGPCGPIPGRSIAGTVPASASVRARRISGSRTGCCPQARRSSTRWPMPPSFWACSGAGRRPTATWARPCSSMTPRPTFLAAAQRGLDAQFTWVDGKTAPAGDLIRRELLPLAWQGLRSAGLDSADVDRYLGVIEQRVASGRNGASWLLSSLADMQGTDTQDALLSALTAATVNRQWEGTPVHEWPLAKIEEGRGGKPQALRIEEFMTTDLFYRSPRRTDGARDQAHGLETGSGTCPSKTRRARWRV